MLNLQLVTSEFSVVFAMCLFQITYVANLTRKQFVVFLSDTMISERDGSVVILLLVDVIHHEM